MKKFYRVLKDNFLWDKDTILENSTNNENGYVAINEIFSKETTEKEYISARIIEGQPEWFQRVYEVNLISKTIYKIKEEAKELMLKNFNN